MLNNIDLWWLLYLGLGLIVAVIFLVLGSVYVTRSKLTKLNDERIKSISISEKKYRGLVETIDDGIIVLDHELNITFANAVFVKKINISLSGIIGKNILELIPSEVLSKCVEDVFVNAKTDKIDLEITYANKKSWFDVTATLQKEENGIKSVLCVFNDITKRKEMEIQLKDLIETLKDQQKSLSRLSKELIRAQEDERKRISHDLHDVIGQRLTAISFNLESARSGSFNDDEISTKLVDASGLVKDTIRDVQDFSFSLRPTILDDLGLTPAMKIYAKKYQKRTGIVVEIKDEQFLEGIESDIKIVLYRIFQEGLTNIAKHSKADNVYIFFNTEPKNIKMFIVDNGIGIDIQKNKNKGLGLLGISERLQMIGGSLDISKSKEKGTQLIITTPYELNG